MLKTLIVDGVECHVVLERSSSDGGLVVNYLTPDKDGVHLNLRHWFQDPSLAQAAFDDADAAKLRETKAAVEEMVGTVKAK